jgi:hypothetical protein
MTGLSDFTPGGELRCKGCEMACGTLSEPACLVAIDLADDCERMTPAACPVCGAPGGGCEVCREELRQAS